MPLVCRCHTEVNCLNDDNKIKLFELKKTSKRLPEQEAQWCLLRGEGGVFVFQTRKGSFQSANNVTTNKVSKLDTHEWMSTMEETRC